MLLIGAYCNSAVIAVCAVTDSYADDPDVPGERCLCTSTILPPLGISLTEEEIRLLRYGNLLGVLGNKQRGKACKDRIHIVNIFQHPSFLHILLGKWEMGAVVY